MPECSHEVTTVRVKLRDAGGEPTLVGHQCVACLQSVMVEPGRLWLPKWSWPPLLEDWSTVPDVRFERQTSLF